VKGKGRRRRNTKLSCIIRGGRRRSSRWIKENKWGEK
jgi:hypothetical protein